MSWIRVNKNTFKAYCKKNNIDEGTKVIIEDKFDGMVDSVVPVDKESYVNLGELFAYGGYIIYDTKKKLFRNISIAVGSYSIIDERFEELKIKFEKVALVENLRANG